MPTDHRLNFTPNLVVGLAIILLGVALLLERLSLVEAATLLRFWPVLLILFGASVAFQALRGRSAEKLAERPIVSSPLILFIVIMGIVLTANGSRGRTVSTDSTDVVSVNSVMSENVRTSRSIQFRGGHMMSVMGASRLDLRQASVPPGTEAVIDVFAVMGAVELFVPRDWTVDVQVVPLMGGVNDERFGRAGRRNEESGDGSRSDAVE